MVEEEEREERGKCRRQHARFLSDHHLLALACAFSHLLRSFPPTLIMSATFRGVVTKVGAMNKTATVSVERLVMHKRTRKVRGTSAPRARLLTRPQMLTRSKKFLTHDEENGPCLRIRASYAR
jgi:ribosomal protein S17